MTVPIRIPWDLYLGQLLVWCECLAAGARRAVLLPRLDTIFSPEAEDPARQVPYESLRWRLVSPTEEDWAAYRALAERQAARRGLHCRAQRVESVAQWLGGRRVAVPQYHLWLYRDAGVGAAIERLYGTVDPAARRALWRWLLAWTAPGAGEPSEPRSSHAGGDEAGEAVTGDAGGGLPLRRDPARGGEEAGGGG